MQRIVSFICFAAALGAVPAFAQYSYSYDRPYADRNYARQDRALFEHTRVDLDRAAAYPYASRADRKRFDEAKRELFDFQNRFDEGRYEKNHLDSAIDHIQKVVESNSLDPRDRGALADDLRRMRDYREFRKHHEALDYPYGYRY